MSNYDDLVKRERHRHLLIVEGNHERNELMELLLKCFPEIDMQLDDIVIYGTNIYMLYQNLEEMYPDGWYEQDVNLPFLVSEKKGITPRYKQDDFTTIMLIFDYERHDPSYSEEKILQMQEYFQDETGVGKLFLNYPMVESYQHILKIPDEDYQDRKVAASMTSGAQYKNDVKNSFVAKMVRLPGKLSEILSERFQISDQDVCKKCVERLLNIKQKESLIEDINEILSGVVQEKELLTAIYQMKATLLSREYIKHNLTYYEYMRWLFQQVIMHNIKKASKIQNNVVEINIKHMQELFYSLNMEKILMEQNKSSRDTQNGFIWVLNTSIFFVPEYNFQLLEVSM